MSASERMLPDDFPAPSSKRVAYEYGPFGDRSDAAAAKVTTYAWKDQLNFERDCSATEPGQRCWLSAELAVWNKVMHRFAFEIVEPEPGRLHLQSMRNATRYFEKSVAATSCEASFLLSGLLKHHTCIDGFRVFSYVCWQKKQFPIRLHPPLNSGPVRHMRCLEISLSHFGVDSVSSTRKPHWYSLEGIDAVSGLEKLKISAPKFSFKLAAELETLLRRNAGTIKTVEFRTAKLPRNVEYALQCLTGCESLKLSLRSDEGHFPGMVPVAQLLRTSTALEELSVFPIVDKSQVSVIADAVKANSSLKELNIRIAQKRCTPEPVFGAMGVNTTLKELCVSDCIIDASCGQALTLALGRNSSLRVLHLADIAISALSMTQLAEALLENTALQRLHISGEHLPMSGISALCKVLTTNKTLKKLAFADFKASTQEREVLAKQLVEIKCYDRVRLPWVAADIPGLLAVLKSPSVCPEELSLHDVQRLPEHDLKLLFGAVSCSKRIRTFKARFEGNLGKRGAYLCQMLKANRSIKCLDIFIGSVSGKLINNVLHILAGNKSIIELAIYINPLREYIAAKHISYFLAHNKAVTKFSLSSSFSLLYEFAEEFGEGLWQNKLIVEFDLARNLFCEESSFTFFEALRRNRATLKRAVEFVVLPRADRQYAEAFELFFRKPCLLAHLIKATGKSEAEAALALTTADHYLQDNYLVITGIVQNSVECYPGSSTQFEKLGRDCWRAIVQHLNVTDVLLP